MTESLDRAKEDLGDATARLESMKVHLLSIEVGDSAWATEARTRVEDALSALGLVSQVLDSIPAEKRMDDFGATAEDVGDVLPESRPGQDGDWG